MVGSFRAELFSDISAASKCRHQRHGAKPEVTDRSCNDLKSFLGEIDLPPTHRRLPIKSICPEEEKNDSGPHKMRETGPAAALSRTRLGRKLHKHFLGSPEETHNELESHFMVGTLWSPKGPGEFWLGSPGPSCFQTTRTDAAKPQPEAFILIIAKQWLRGSFPSQSTQL